jgi:glycosyltransferase involved in cell wall biosynthesis
MASLESCRPRHVIANPYDAKLFFDDGSQRRERDILFIGSQNPHKGGQILLMALKLLVAGGLSPTITIVGELTSAATKALRGAVESQGLLDRVVFSDYVSNFEIAALMSRHRILVVPSIWPEPFGIVVLEGLASGCCVIASNAGGLPEAVGRCGMLFQNGNANELAKCLELAMIEPTACIPPSAICKAHLSRHQPKTVAKEHLRHLFEIMAGPGAVPECRDRL